MPVAKKILTAVPEQPPSELEMEAVLGDAYAGFRTLVEEAGAGAAEWRRYTKNSPWVLKVSEGKRSLFYARPDGGHLSVTVLLGDLAVDAALAGGVRKSLHDSIRRAKRHPEGRPVVVVVRRASDLAKVVELIEVKRASGSRPSKRRAPGGRTRR